MQIQSIQQYGQIKSTQQPQFKSVYPVRIWVREIGGGYMPVVSRDMTKTLTTKVVNILNKSKNELIFKYNEICEDEKRNGTKARTELSKSRLKIANWIKNFIAKFDKDYALQNDNPNMKPTTRAFYVNGGFYKGHINPCAYLITGAETMYFDGTYGKPIGLSIKMASGRKDTAEYEQACADYWKKGFNYVHKRAKNFKLNDSPSELHVKMETVRGKTGNIKGYNITGIGFFPQNGPENPLELTEWLTR